MADYSFAGNGQFGGSSNFLSMLGGVGQDWGDGMMGGMRMGTTLLNYQNMVNTNPSAQRAQIAQNLVAQGQATIDHMRNLLLAQPYSQQLSGAPQSSWQNGIMFGNGAMQQGLTGTTAGTPQNTQPNAQPSTQVAQPVTPSTTNGVYMGGIPPQWGNNSGR